MNHTLDTTYELTNKQRMYLGLLPIKTDWEKLPLTSTIVVYFDQNRIMKVINYSWGYLEYDTIIETVNREFLLPKTSRGKQQKLSVSKLLKIKGSGIQFSGSFQGGGIHVYDHNRNIFFIKSFAEDGEIRNYGDIDKWVDNYIARLPPDYLTWLAIELSQGKKKVRIEAGDFISFKLSLTEYGFARVLSNVYSDLIRKVNDNTLLNKFHPRSLIVVPYVFSANTPNVEIEKLIDLPTLPAVCIFDLEVYRGGMPIIGHKSLSEREKLIPFPAKAGTSATFSITISDMEEAKSNLRK